MTQKSILMRLATIVAINMIMAVDVGALGLELGTGIWAQSGVKPTENSAAIGVVESPDRKFSIRSHATGLEFVVKDQGASVLNVVATGQLWEVVWSHSSRAFSINASDGGAVGTWETFAFNLKDAGKVTAVPVNELVLVAAKRFPICDTPEDPNIGIVGWSKDGSVAFVVAEVPPHSSCRNMGAIRGFEVSVKEARIVKRLSEQEVRKRWSVHLGCRFRITCS